MENQRIEFMASYNDATSFQNFVVELETFLKANGIKSWVQIRDKAGEISDADGLPAESMRVESLKFPVTCFFSFEPISPECDVIREAFRELDPAGHGVITLPQTLQILDIHDDIVDTELVGLIREHPACFQGLEDLNDEELLAQIRQEVPETLDTHCGVLPPAAELNTIQVTFTNLIGDDLASFVDLDASSTTVRQLQRLLEAHVPDLPVVQQRLLMGTKALDRTPADTLCAAGIEDGTVLIATKVLAMCTYNDFVDRLAGDVNEPLLTEVSKFFGLE